MAQPPLAYQLKVANTIILAEKISSEGEKPATFQIKEILKSTPDSTWNTGDLFQTDINMFSLLGRTVKSGQEVILFFLNNNQQPFEMLLNENGQYQYGQDDPTIASDLNLAEIKAILKG